MKKEIKSLMIILAMGASLTALSLGGTAGCGSNAGGGGSQTTAQQQAAQLQLVNSLSQLSSLGTSGGSPAALSAKSEQIGLKLQSACNPTAGPCACTSGGTYQISETATSATVTFNSCNFGSGAVDGAISFDFSSETSFEMTFSNFTSEIADCGTYTVNGSIGGSVSGTPPNESANLTFNITTAHSGASSTLTGDLTINPDDTLTGSVMSNNPTLNCSFNNTPATCQAIAAACGVSDSVCNGDDFDENVCQ